MGNKLVITLVLYNEKLSELPSYLLLKELITSYPFVQLFLYDNSPQSQEDELIDQQQVMYVHDQLNSGLATAYNHAIDFFYKKDSDLLILLDQDTLITKEYISYLINMTILPEIGAYLPLVVSKGQQLSPLFGQRKRVIPVEGIYTQRLLGINSGSVLPKRTVDQLGSFNLDFPLDFLDHWFYWTLHNAHEKIAVLPYQLEHNLSVQTYTTISENRYESIIGSETLFYKKYDVDRLSQHSRQLLLRTIKQFLTLKNRKIWRRTLKEYISLLKGK